MSGSWIGFYDLLGTKDSARLRRSDFPGKLKLFGDTLKEHASQLKCSAKVRFFADSAYIECEDPSRLLEFSRRVRRALFSEEIFFKAALAPGALGDNSVHIIVDEDGKRHNGGAVEGFIDIRGVTFGDRVSEVYYEQENFKGVGYYISAKHGQSVSDGYLVDSCFPADGGRQSWVAFKDISFTDQEVGGLFRSEDNRQRIHVEASEFLDQLLGAALRANKNKKDLSRYYFSAFMTIIQSSNFSKVDYHEDSWDGVPVVFNHMFQSELRRPNYTSLKGADALYFAVVNKIFNMDEEILDRDGKKIFLPKYRNPSYDNTCNALVSMLGNMKLLGGAIGSYPDFVLSPDVREDIARRAVRLQMLGMRRRRPGTTSAEG